MGLHRFAAKRDANEPLIVEYLEARGAMVNRVSAPDLPDLLVGWCGRWLLFEVKTEKGRMQAGQAAFAAEAERRGCPRYTVSTIEQVKEVLDGYARRG